MFFQVQEISMSPDSTDSKFDEIPQQTAPVGRVGLHDIGLGVGKFHFFTP